MSRHAPTRTRTDPYTGLPWYLCEKTRFVGLWGRANRPAAFENHCERVIETKTNGWAIPSSFLAVWRIRKGRHRPDAVVCGTDEYSLIVGLLAGKLAHAPVFCVVEDPPFTDRYGQEMAWGRKQERRIRCLVLRTLLKACSGIFCFIEKDVLNGLNLATVPIYQLMNGVSSQAMEWLGRQRREKRGSPQFIIGYVGAINKRQGIGDLLEIFSLARSKTTEVRLRLIGPIDNDYGKCFDDKIHKLGLDTIVEMTGWSPYEKMLEKLNDCDVGVYCNPATEWFRFAQPLKICEYLALGKPVVAWDYPGTRRLLGQGRYGILVPPGNKAAFRDALVSLAGLNGCGAMQDEIHVAVRGHWSSDYWYNQVLSMLANSRKG